MKVQPITDVKDIKRIKRLLDTNLRDLLLFVFGINTGLRVQDILALRIDTVHYCPGKANGNRLFS